LITSAEFDRVVYKFPRLNSRGTQIPRLLGLDSEAYDTGKPFMICLSTGALLKPEDMPGALFDHCDGEHVAVYNLKYDSGAVLYHMPEDIMGELWEKTRTHWGPYLVEYIPHKSLTFTRGRDHWVRLWDVSQFYAMSLDNAAQRYLGKRKLDVETKTFRQAYVRKHWAKLKRYCVRDAQLCAELGDFLLDKLGQFGIRATALYSSASLSFRYFADRCRIVTSWRFWKRYRELLPYAMDSYEGGKFEVTARASCEAHEYDIVSAYPYEIAQLVDISTAEVIKSKRYHPGATYGFIRAEVYNPRGLHVPCGLMLDGVRVYPAGRYFVTITKAEYEYLREIGVEVRILSAYWLAVRWPTMPYAEVVAELFALKARYKGNDAMLYEVSKRMLNSFYGKTCQMIPDWKGNVNAGLGWNPMYASIITANTRIAMCRAQNMLGPRCLAVHTDSVITTEPLPADMVTGQLGGFAHEVSGPATIIACGMYEIDGSCAFKGLEPPKGETWRAILGRNKRREFIEYPVLRVESWVESMAKGHRDRINLFEHGTKQIDLNCDTKRVWHRRVTGGDLLGPVEQSTPRILRQAGPPEYWPT